MVSARGCTAWGWDSGNVLSCASLRSRQPIYRFQRARCSDTTAVIDGFQAKTGYHGYLAKGRHTRTSVFHWHHRVRLDSPSAAGLDRTHAQPNVLACGPVPPRTGGLPDLDGTRVGLPAGRNRSMAAGSPSPCTPFGARARRIWLAGPHHGSIRPGDSAVGGHARQKGAHGRRPGYRRYGVRRLESRLRQPS